METASTAITGCSCTESARARIAPKRPNGTASRAICVPEPVKKKKKAPQKKPATPSAVGDGDVVLFLAPVQPG